MVVFSATSSWSVHFLCLPTTSGYGVVDVSHVAMLRNIGGTCVSNNLWLGPSAGHGDLNYHDVAGNGSPNIGISS